MILRLAAATVLLVAGCGSSQESGASAAEARIDACTERFLDRTESETAEIRRYVQTTYCARFEELGWIHEDGTLNIAAHTERGTEKCEQADEPGSSRTIPCEEVQGSLEVLDCGLLHLVRRDEVSEYVEKLQRTREVRCDDGTALDELGAR